MIESGTLVPGVTADQFGLPADTALRFELPAPTLAGSLSDYHVIDSVVPPGALHSAHMLPAWPAVRFVFSEPATLVAIGDGAPQAMPVAGLYGTTTRALLWTNGGGVMIGASLTPLGWARLFGTPASRFRDRIVGLETVMPPPLVADVIARLRGSDMALQVKAILDRFFEQVIGPPTRDDADIALILQWLGDDSVADLTATALAAAISPERLRRLALRYFGFPPKTLWMRARFLRSFLKMLIAQGRDGGPIDYRVIDDSYYDLSHFLRDADRFLGMTPKRFLDLPHNYLRAAVRARMLILGVPLHAFDRPAGSVAKADVRRSLPG